MNTAIYTVGLRPRKRHLYNPAHRLWWADCYQGMWVQAQKGPLIENYLESLLCVMNQARNDCGRLLAIRVDLRFPVGYMGYAGTDNRPISSFLYYLHSQLDIAGITKPHKMRYAWCHERSTSQHHHYHLLLLLNGDAYNTLGCMMKSEDGGYGYNNLYHRIVRAWADSLNWPQEGMELLARIPEKPCGGLATWFFRSDDQAAFANVFGAASYLCKEATKPIGQGVHCFDASRS